MEMAIPLSVVHTTDVVRTKMAWKEICENYDMLLNIAYLLGFYFYERKQLRFGRNISHTDILPQQGIAFFK